jgi:hypothetical protein
MYKVVVVVLFKAGDHVPVILLSDVVSNGVSVAPEQIAVTGSNVGVIIGLIVTDVVAVTPGTTTTCCNYISYSISSRCTCRRSDRTGC